LGRRERSGCHEFYKADLIRVQSGSQLTEDTHTHTHTEFSLTLLDSFSWLFRARWCWLCH